MSNVAVIFAGGTGQRMNTRTWPKQFLELHGKPIIVYTLEAFDSHPEIDGIVVVMLESWIDYMQELIRKFNLKKVKKVVPGGASGQESIYNGLCAAAQFYGEDDIVLIHDGVRPLIDEETITANIRGVEERGTAITVTAAIETITMKDETGAVGTIIDRSKCGLARAPQSFRLGPILGVHNKIRQDPEASGGFIDSASLMKHYGYKLYTVQGMPENIKITTPSDYYIFRAMVDARENSQIFGV
jgi:2-C-methyl-D-erythritol 4-phosphate cytidylyltransferase